MELTVNIRSTKEELVLSILPLLKLICLTVIGLILAHPKTQLVPKATFKLLSKLVFALFLPCMIFIHLGETITVKNFLRWWFIPTNVILSTVIGCLLGWLVARICRPRAEYFRFTVIMTAFGNTGNLPLAIVGSVCRSDDHPFGPDCHALGTAYVSFAQWVAVLLVYTLVYHMMEPPMEYYEVVDVGAEIHEQVPTNDLSRPLLVEAEWPGMEDRETEHCKSPLIARVFGNQSDISIPDVESLDGSSSVAPESPKSLRCLAEPRVMKKIRIVAEKTPLFHVLQPPTFATLLAFFVGMVPPIKSVVYGNDAPLSFITDSLEILAGAMVPSVMLILGGMLSEGPNESRLGLRTTIGIIVARLLVLPMIGVGVVTLADKLNFLIPGDQMYRLVLLLQYTTPSAILLGAVASLRGYAVCEASSLLFWQHICAVLSLAIYMVVYFKMLIFYV
ncbi:protein PIN-LIKES 2 [Andrographis paniculata]|uniref:protein PIN-LIKES 2 n=1 Tax=Andrographis paniculata TaxID=175694 RepID=UPI0021E7A4AC|nr:protein PIN-LIKES 2 [Andrographis paniculata]XP_051126731.1 protein PIN-LIKES 2 [Andrographis paniculata]XP_051126732.1 protein PIN-LIKES 2 [Andrographis paniculata]XP_051126733.1 protein PIN-LIKES 2 [Andrographis paniculata]XP_051126735.1 protein PIN-LIKES 2 [Andrographis paniculata]XP_051126736.1 protein PIN-LIKES 2 [Andrographis paniculata]XP_051126737.1 protein PIN-LIKES 2 [Andrographis paniculata]XP_051126738.1 protein PIN-LIKES 2 [Andrographis paniculata]